MNTPSTSPRLHLLPVSLRTANAFVLSHHRHHRPVQGAKFALAVTLSDSDLIHGVAIVGRPVARHLDAGSHAAVHRRHTQRLQQALRRGLAGGKGAGLHTPAHLHHARRRWRQPAPRRLAADRRARWRRLEPSRPSARRYPRAPARRQVPVTGAGWRGQREAPGCRLIAAARARPRHAGPMPADVVSDMPGNHRSSRLRRSSHCVTEPARTASFRERPPASGGGCFRLINPPRGHAPSPHAWAGVSPLHPNGDSP